MSKLVSHPVTILSAVEARLQAIRRNVVTWFWIDGLCKVLWAAIGLFALDLAADWLFRMDLSQRVIMLLLMAAALGYLVYRSIIQPLSHGLSDDAIALQVEDRNPQLHQRLISALQFARMSDIEDRGMSVTLVRQTVVSGLESADTVNFSNVVNWNRLKWNSLLLATAAIILGGVGVGIVQGSPAAIWFKRNILLGDSTWPQNTYLIVERMQNGKVVFPRGGDWTQTVGVTENSSIVPELVTLEFRSARGRAPQPMKKTGDRRFEAVFANVLEPFEFRARGGDALTPWVRVDLVEPPAVEGLELKLTLPKYAGGTTEALPPGKGPYFFLKGSSLSLSGTANKPLRRAALIVDGNRHELSLDKSQSVRGSLSAEELKPGQYVIELEDELGLASIRPTTFGLRLRADREPRLKGRLVGIGGIVTPKAKLPLNLKVTDDFGLTKIHAEYHWLSDDPQRPSGEGTIDFPALVERKLEREISFDDVIELPPLNLPIGARLTFKFVGADNDDVSGPNVGKSSEFLLRVVTEEELRSELLRREKEQRQEFERLVKTEEEILTDTRALAAESKEAADLSPEHRNTLMQIQRKQKLIAVNTAGIAERIELIVVESLNNRLDEEGGPLEQRLRRDVIAPLRMMAGEMVPETLDRLDQARRLATKPEDRAAAFDAAAESEQKLLEEMRRVLSFLIKAEGFQEAINLLLEIQKSQQEVLDRTTREKQERIKRILEGRDKPGDQPLPEKPSPEGQPEQK